MRRWTYEPIACSSAPLLERLRRFPREPDMLQYGVRSLSALAIRAWLKLYHRFEIHGLENLPKERSAVIIANHCSHLDALCLLSAVPIAQLHRAFPAAAADYFFESLPRTALSVLIVNALPFDREAHVRESLAICGRLLANPGNLLIVFPEGTRSGNGQIGPFRPGIGSLVAGSEIPVIPCHLSGTHAALPKGCWLPRPRRIRLDVGKALSFTQSSSDRESVRAICCQMREAVVELMPGNKRSVDEQLMPAPSANSPVWAAG